MLWEPGGYGGPPGGGEVMAPTDDPACGIFTFSRSPKLARLGIGAGIGAVYGAPVPGDNVGAAGRSAALNS